MASPCPQLSPVAAEALVVAFQRPRWFGLKEWNEICQAKWRWLTTDSSSQGAWPLTPVVDKMMPVFFKGNDMYKHCAGNVQVIPWYLNMAFGERAPSERVLLMEILFEAQVSPATDTTRLAHLVSLTDQHLGIYQDWSKMKSNISRQDWQMLVSSMKCFQLFRFNNSNDTIINLFFTIILCWRST